MTMLIQPVCGNAHAVSRRNLLAAVPAAAMMPVAVMAEVPRDPHPAWLAEWRVNRDTVNEHPTAEGEDVDVLDARRFKLDRLISSIPARTMDGVLAQLSWLIEDGHEFWGCDDHRVAADTIRSGLEALA